MSEAKGQQEPSMEEILASIRRIISEDNDARPASEGAAATEVKDDVLELTDVVDDHDTPVMEPAAPEPAAEIYVAPEPVPPPEPRPVAVEPPAPLPEFDEPAVLPVETARSVPDMSDFTESERLISDETAAASTASFAEIANRMRERRSGDLELGNGAATIEEIVRQMLKPMLAEWLDDHLPSMVERLVREEIKRVASGSVR
ncbi:MAG TPA: DUF2497 domain-containing protein [Stellaceae bacterium]|nr:DUF2497 domain-containing protein [Stellaceae bacterium]